ncbi:hypothetical protein [Paraburkholderia fungorum]|uniref:hypothetical protein n=1 Tax=Paraburkholderia fungorum TaxID=134537 RepID=UPI0038B87C30
MILLLDEGASRGAIIKTVAELTFLPGSYVKKATCANDAMHMNDCSPKKQVEPGYRPNCSRTAPDTYPIYQTNSTSNAVF